MAQRDLIDIHNDNLYDILGVQHDATIKQISKYYRKKALKYHPDKNPDPTAHKMFLKLTQIMELLSNETARSNYDTILKARAAAKLRTQQLDSKRRKLKESLECKERRMGDSAAQYAEKQLKETIKRLQNEGESLLRREEEKLRKEFSVRTSVVIADRATIKLKWKCKKDNSNDNGGYSESILRDILSKYGPVSDIVVNAKRTGSALVVFDSIASAKICMQKEKGLELCPLSFRMIHDSDKSTKPSVMSPTVNVSNQQDGAGGFSSFPGSTVTSSVPFHNVGDIDRDYESLTLMRLRQAEERKRLIDEIKGEEDDDCSD